MAHHSSDVAKWGAWEGILVIDMQYLEFSPSVNSSAMRLSSAGSSIAQVVTKYYDTLISKILVITLTLAQYFSGKNPVLLQKR